MSEQCPYCGANIKADWHVGAGVMKVVFHCGTRVFLDYERTELLDLGVYCKGEKPNWKGEGF